MSKRAFTLVELMGMLIILSAIMLIGIPSIIKMLNQSEKKKMDIFLDNIYAATEIYVEKKPDNFSFSSSSIDIVLLEELILNGYLDGDMINPKSDNKIKYESSLIEVSKSQANLTLFNYVYQENNTVITVNSIEDLVILAKSVSDGSDKQGMRYHLTTDLDFNSNVSYDDPTTVSYGDLNDDSIISDLKTELTTNNGFIPIGSRTNPFKGSFYGRGHSIKNLLINRDTIDDVGLFGYIDGGTLNGIYLFNANVLGNNKVGILAGAANNSLIYGIYTTGTVSSSNTLVSGILAENINSELKDSSSNATIQVVE